MISKLLADMKREVLDDKEMDEFIDLVLPLVRSSLGKNYEHCVQDAMLDLKPLIETYQIGGEGGYYGGMITILRYVRIVCSYYTLNVPFEKMPYWDSCINRDLKQDEQYDSEMSEGFKKAMSRLNEFEGNLLLVKNQLKASDKEVSILFGLKLKDVEKEYMKAMDKLISELEKEGIIVTD